MATAAALQEAAGADQDQGIHPAPARHVAARRPGARLGLRLRPPASLGTLHTKRVASSQCIREPTGEWVWHSFRFQLGPIEVGSEVPDEHLELFLLAQRQFLCDTDRSLKHALLHCASGVRHFHLAKPILRQAFCDAASALLGLSWKAPTTAAAVFNRKLNDLLLWGSRCAPSVAWLRLRPEALSS